MFKAILPLLVAAVGATSPTCVDSGLEEVVGLNTNLEILDASQQKLAQTLVCSGQQHLFTEWPKPGENDAEKKQFFDQVAGLDESYPGTWSSFQVMAFESSLWSYRWHCYIFGERQVTLGCFKGR